VVAESEGTMHPISQRELLERARTCDLDKLYEALTDVMLDADQRGLLLAVLTVRDIESLADTFLEIDAATLACYVKHIRSGVVGRRSFGTRPKKLIQEWLNARTPNELLEGTGRVPTMGDIIKCTHPCPKDGTHARVFAYLTGHADQPPPILTVVAERRTG
jgi:60 kDa SS-A/Ro ribonucleoprotein